MRKLMLALAVTAVTLAGTAYAEDKKFTIGVSIPAADHGWTWGVVFHAERVAKQLMAEHPGLNVIVKTSPDAASQANAVQDLDTQGIDALVILPSDPDPLVNAIKEVKGKGKFVALVDRAPSTNDNSVRDLYVAGNNPALGEVAGKYIAEKTPDAEVVDHPRPADPDRPAAPGRLRQGHRRLEGQGSRQPVRQLEPRRRLQGHAGLPDQVSEDRRGLVPGRRHGSRRAAGDRPGQAHRHQVCRRAALARRTWSRRSWTATR